MGEVDGLKLSPSMDSKILRSRIIMFKHLQRIMELLRLEKMESNHSPLNHKTFFQRPLKNNSFTRPWWEG